MVEQRTCQALIFFIRSRLIKPISFRHVRDMDAMNNIISKICPTEITSISSLENPKVTSCSTAGVLAASQVRRHRNQRNNQQKIRSLPTKHPTEIPFRHISRSISKKQEASKIASATEGIPSLSPTEISKRQKNGNTAHNKVPDQKMR